MLFWYQLTSTFNYDNIDSKIKKLAKIICIIGVIGSILGGLGVLFGAFASGEFWTVLVGLLLGVLIALIGSILSWVGSFVLYGFGQLIENTDPKNKSL